MSDFVAFFTYLSSTPLFGLAATLSAYILAVTIYTRLNYNPWANPVLWSVVTLIALLLITKTPYPRYFSGAQFIHFLLGPAVVALAWPLWVRREVLARHARPLLLAAVIGGAVGSGAAVGMGWLLGLPPSVLLSLAPKAITAPVAMGIAQSIQGIPELAAVFVLTTGLIGAILGSYVFKLIGEHQWPVQGFAFGTQAHGFGTARALQLNAEAGAYAGLALGLQALLGSLLIPLIHTLFR
ncbi:MAG: LrgB family protein [Brachymonas denitrificans]|jgi:putative effector of murein hydrolase|uniref:LrgB family protein n=1 Tax=Brachymonas denitrificans TaxID=28220 RepID=UPI001BCE1E31|nr:LrgB family protein [Brachymonas denitrificans]